MNTTMCRVATYAKPLYYNCRACNAPLNGLSETGYCEQHSGNKPVNFVRDETIREMVASGMRQVDVARAYKMSRQLVNSIVHQQVTR
jgi:hypothetical protein